MLRLRLSDMFRSENGMGFLLMNASRLNQVKLVLLAVAFAAGVNLLLLSIDRHLHGSFW